MESLFILLVLGVANTQQKVVPVNITYETPQPVSVNGSSEIGHCSNGGPTCFEPTTSVLYDGEIPPLYGLDRHQWAAQLLTLNASGEIAILTFDFTGQSGYEGAKGVEVVLFNCPEWGIAVENIMLLHRNASMSRRFLFGFSIAPNSTSCDSFVKVGMHFDSYNSTNLSLAFLNSPWVHLAEVTFYTEYHQISNIDLILNNTSTTSKPPEKVTSKPDTLSNNTANLVITNFTTIEPSENVTSIPNISIIMAVVTIAGIMAMLAVLLAKIILKHLRHRNKYPDSITSKGSTTTDVFGSITTEEAANNLPIESVYDDLFPLYDEIRTNIPQERIEDSQTRHNYNYKISTFPNEGMMINTADVTLPATLPANTSQLLAISTKSLQLSAASKLPATLPATSDESGQLPATSVESSQLPATSVESSQPPATSVERPQLLATSIESSQLPATSNESSAISDESSQLLPATSIETTSVESSQLPATGVESSQLLAISTKSLQLPVASKLPATSSAISIESSQLPATSVESSQLLATNDESSQLLPPTSDESSQSPATS